MSLLGAASVTDSAAVPCIARDSSCLGSLAAVAMRPREERGERREERRGDTSQGGRDGHERGLKEGRQQVGRGGSM